MSATRFATLSLLLLPLITLGGSAVWAQAPSSATWAHQGAASPPAALCSTQVALAPEAAPAPTLVQGAVPAQSCAPGQPCAQAPVAAACSTGCNGKCKNEWHCPKYCFAQEKMPCIKFACVCAKPLAEPCSVADEVGYGYTPTCWRPMGPLDYTHCTCPPPAILAQEPGQRPRFVEPQPERAPERAPADEPAPAPNRVGLSSQPRP